LHIILGEINKNYVKADPKVYHDYDKLRSTCVNQEKEISVNEKVDANSVVQLCLLNIRSLRKQSCVRHDSDILAFTDTQLLPRDDKFSSLGVCIKKNIRTVYQKRSPSLNVLKFGFSRDNK
ncbi:hypothetical protein pdam_00020237, partial [Pocillopora damicornis]